MLASYSLNLLPHEGSLAALALAHSAADHGPLVPASHCRQVDASGSTGSGGRAMTYYWTVTPNRGADTVSTLQRHLWCLLRGEEDGIVAGAAVMRACGACGE